MEKVEKQTNWKYLEMRCINSRIYCVNDIVEGGDRNEYLSFSSFNVENHLDSELKEHGDTI